MVVANIFGNRKEAAERQVTESRIAVYERHGHPRPLSPLQDPMQRVLWHELGQALREHYGDVGIRHLLTRLIGPRQSTTIALEAGAEAAIIWTPSPKGPDRVRRKEIFVHVDGLGIRSSELLVRDADVQAWIDEHRDELAGCIRSGGNYSTT